MKIGINARFLLHPFTGIGQYTRNLVCAMAAKEPKNEYFLFMPELSDISFPENCRQIRVAEHPYRSESIKKAHWEHILVPREMEKLGVSIAHFPYPSNPRRNMAMPAVVTVHDVIPWRLKEYRARLRSKAYSFFARLALKKANHIITVSEFSKTEIVKYLKISPENVTVVYNAPPLASDTISFPDINLRRRYFLYAGGYDSRKNVPMLMHAYQKHIAPFYAVDLILIGGKGRGLEEFLTGEYLERIGGKYPVKARGKIIFTDQIEQDELHCLFSHASALVHVSFYEGFNLPLAEAMSAGIPIVAADIPVNREITAGNAIFVNPDNIDSAGLGMHELLNNPVLYEKLAAAGKERSKYFSWEKAAEETLYVYSLFT